MKSIRNQIENFVYQLFQKFSQMVYDGGEETEFYGIKVLKEKENFVRGTLVNATASLYIHYINTKDQRAENAYKSLLKFLDGAISHKCSTWGKLSVLRGLVALKDANLLDKIPTELIEKAMISTDYSDFLNKDTLELLGLPSNYLQVALACALFREKLGFECDGFSEKIASHFYKVLQTSADAWMDEAPPYRRYDRYSFIVSSELSDAFLLADKPFDGFLKENLRLAAEHCLFMANRRGDGWNYGRSLSCHGDCAIAEVLSSALARGLIQDDKKSLAISYISKIFEKTLTFWYDKDRESFNIWWDGRSTNGYRQVHRVMQVCLDMGLHLLSTLRNLTVAGLDGAIPDESLIPSPDEWIYDEIKFHSDKNQISEAISLRKGDRLIMLPLIGLGHHISNAAYMPFPALCNEIEAAPEAHFPFLTPEYTIDSKVYRPCQYFKSITVSKENGSVKVKALGNLAICEEKFPIESSIAFNTVYTFNKNEISATFSISSNYEKAEMVTGTHSNKVKIDVFGFGDEKIIFENPLIENYKTFNVNELTDENRYPYFFMTPHGFITQAKLYKSNKSNDLSYKITLP